MSVSPTASVPVECQICYGPSSSVESVSITVSHVGDDRLPLDQRESHQFHKTCFFEASKLSAECPCCAKIVQKVNNLPVGAFLKKEGQSHFNDACAGVFRSLERCIAQNQPVTLSHLFKPWSLFSEDVLNCLRRMPDNDRFLRFFPPFMESLDKALPIPVELRTFCMDKLKNYAREGGFDSLNAMSSHYPFTNGERHELLQYAWNIAPEHFNQAAPAILKTGPLNPEHRNELLTKIFQAAKADSLRILICTPEALQAAFDLAFTQGKIQEFTTLLGNLFTNEERHQLLQCAWGKGPECFNQAAPAILKTGPLNPEHRNRLLTQIFQAAKVDSLRILTRTPEALQAAFDLAFTQHRARTIAVLLSDPNLTNDQLNSVFLQSVSKLPNLARWILDQPPFPRRITKLARGKALRQSALRNDLDLARKILISGLIEEEHLIPALHTLAELNFLPVLQEQNLRSLRDLMFLLLEKINHGDPRIDQAHRVVFQAPDILSLFPPHRGKCLITAAQERNYREVIRLVQERLLIPNTSRLKALRILIESDDPDSLLSIQKLINSTEITPEDAPSVSEIMGALVRTNNDIIRGLFLTKNPQTIPAYRRVEAEILNERGERLQAEASARNFGKATDILREGPIFESSLVSTIESAISGLSSHIEDLKRDREEYTEEDAERDDLLMADLVGYIVRRIQNKDGSLSGHLDQPFLDLARGTVQFPRTMRLLFIPEDLVSNEARATAFLERIRP